MPKPVQGELFEARHRRRPEDLAALLGRGLKREVRIVLHRNRVCMASLRFFPRGPVAVRLHEAFLDAPLYVLSALSFYLRTRRHAAWKVVADFACTIPDGAVVGPEETLETRGRVYDLAEVRDAVNRRFFEGKVGCRIGWGRARRRNGRRGGSRSIQFGSYIREQNLVRIHPALDSRRVPREFLEYIVFHEMLHAVVPSRLVNGRLIHHSREFMTREHGFPDVHRMHHLSKRLVGVL